MPPKVYIKPTRDQQSSRSTLQDNQQRLPQTQKWDINLKHVAQNSHIMQRINTLTSILAGVIAGLFNANLYGGIFAYIALHLIITVFIVRQIGKIEQYFMKKSQLLSGLGNGIMVFLCGWIITFNVVYTL